MQNSAVCTQLTMVPIPLPYSNYHYHQLSMQVQALLAAPERARVRVTDMAQVMYHVEIANRVDALFELNVSRISRLNFSLFFGVLKEAIAKVEESRRKAGMSDEDIETLNRRWRVQVAAAFGGDPGETLTLEKVAGILYAASLGFGACDAREERSMAPPGSLYPDLVRGRRCRLADMIPAGKPPTFPYHPRYLLDEALPSDTWLFARPMREPVPGLDEEQDWLLLNERIVQAMRSTIISRRPEALEEDEDMERDPVRLDEDDREAVIEAGFLSFYLMLRDCIDTLEPAPTAAELARWRTMMSLAYGKVQSRPTLVQVAADLFTLLLNSDQCTSTEELEVARGVNCRAVTVPDVQDDDWDLEDRFVVPPAARKLKDGDTRSRFFEHKGSFGEYWSSLNHVEDFRGHQLVTADVKLKRWLASEEWMGRRREEQRNVTESLSAEELEEYNRAPESVKRLIERETTVRMELDHPTYTPSFRRWDDIL